MATNSSGFHLADGKGYMLNQGYTVACRLNLQSYLWKESLNFDLHPLSSLDILHPVPEHLVERYDVVHLHLLILVVENGDPTPIIANAYRMLKPGGYIQWDDLNYPDTTITKTEASIATPAFDRLRKFVYPNGRHDWVLNLPTILQKSGFVDVRLEHFQDRKELAMANGEQHLMTMGEFAASLRQKVMVEDANTVLQLITDCIQEGSQEVALSMPRVVVVAEKPVHGEGHIDLLKTTSSDHKLYEINQDTSKPATYGTWVGEQVDEQTLHLLKKDIYPQIRRINGS